MASVMMRTPIVGHILSLIGAVKASPGPMDDALRQGHSLSLVRYKNLRREQVDGRCLFFPVIKMSAASYGRECGEMKKDANAPVNEKHGLRVVVEAFDRKGRGGLRRRPYLTNYSYFSTFTAIMSGCSIVVSGLEWWWVCALPSEMLCVLL